MRLSRVGGSIRREISSLGPLHSRLPWRYACLHVPSSWTREQVMSKMQKRTHLFSEGFRREYPMAKAFLAPQREHPKQPMPKVQKRS